MRTALFTPRENKLRRKLQRARWLRDNKDWFVPKMNEARNIRYATDVVFRDTHKRQSNDYNRRMRELASN